MTRLPVLLALLAASCSTSSLPPNAAMSAPTGPVETAFVRQHPIESEIKSEVSYPGDPARLAQSNISEIALERTSCYGYCPMYTVVFRSDGSAEYTGRGNVPLVGSKRGTISTAQFAELAAMAEALKISDMADSYVAAVTDSPTVFVSIKRQTDQKIIRHYAPNAGGPLGLRVFERSIDEIAEAVTWK